MGCPQSPKKGELFVANLSFLPKFTRILDVAVTRPDGRPESCTEFESGKSVASANLQVTLRKTDKKRTGDFLYNMYHLPIINDRVRRVFEEQHVNNVEYVPVRIRGASPPKEQYVLVNVLDQSDIVDWGKSKYETWLPVPGSSVKFFSKVVLRGDRIPPVSMFYMETPHLLIMRRQLVEAILKVRLTGLEFQDLLAYTGEFSTVASRRTVGGGEAVRHKNKKTKRTTMKRAKG